MYLSKLLFFVAFIFSLEFASATYAQNLNENMSAQEFDDYITELKKGFDSRLLSGDSLSNFVFNKLKKGYFLSDQGIVGSVNLLSRLEYGKNWTDENHPYYYRMTLFIDSLLNVIYGRDDLELKLIEEKVKLIRSDGKGNKVVEKESYLNMLSIINSSLTNLQVKKSYFSLALGDIFFKTDGDKENAAKYYGNVLSYPFYEYEDWDRIVEMKDNYITACLRNIEMNRGNIKGLSEILYVPSVKYAIDPILKKYVEEAGGDWEEFLELQIQD